MPLEKCMLLAPNRHFEDKYDLMAWMICQTALDTSPLLTSFAMQAGIYSNYLLDVVLWKGALMGIMDAANDLVEQGKAALDANADGNVELKEVADAVVAQAKGVIDAAASAVDGVKQSLDIDEDGKVSLEEVQLVAEDVVDKARGAVTGLIGKVKGN